MAKKRRRNRKQPTGQNRSQAMPIDALPDDVLLEIFDFYVEDSKVQNQRAWSYCTVKEEKGYIETWQSLVHVCRRWRNVVFGSPHRLNLQLVCGAKTPAREMLDIWPALRLCIHCHGSFDPMESMDNIIDVLERSDRVYQIILTDVSSSNLKKALAAMREPFPELTYLDIRVSSYELEGPVLPDSFLGSSARLRNLALTGIPFPGLPKLLLSATHLVNLDLCNLPHSGYVSPEVMVTAIATLTSLGFLRLEFRSPQSCPDQASRRPPPPTRSLLPVLTVIRFQGVSEYLEDLVARIDAPRINSLHINLFNQFVFDIPQSIQFISRTPMLKALDDARVYFADYEIGVGAYLKTPIVALNMKVPSREMDWQLSSLDEVRTSYLSLIFTPEDLYIHKDPFSQLQWQDNIGNTLWLELFHPFTTVKSLYLSEEFALHIVPALKVLVGGRTLEVLPALQNIFLEGLQSSGPVQEGIEQYVAARQATGHLIAVSRWNRGKETDD